MVGRSGKKSIGDVVETFILTIGGKVYTDSNMAEQECGVASKGFHLPTLWKKNRFRPL